MCPNTNYNCKKNRMNISKRKSYKDEQNLDFIEKNFQSLTTDIEKEFSQKNNANLQYKTAAVKLLQENNTLKTTINQLTAKLSKLCVLYKQLQYQNNIIQTKQKQKTVEQFQLSEIEK